MIQKLAKSYRPSRQAPNNINNMNVPAVHNLIALYPDPEPRLRWSAIDEFRLEFDRAAVGTFIVHRCNNHMWIYIKCPEEQLLELDSGIMFKIINFKYGVLAILPRDIQVIIEQQKSI